MNLSNEQPDENEFIKRTRHCIEHLNTSKRNDAAAKRMQVVDIRAYNFIFISEINISMTINVPIFNFN